MSQKHWTEEEIEILRKWYPIIGVQPNPKDAKSLMDMLNRTKNSVKRKAVRLGLKRNNQNFWTEEEEEILKKWYPLIGYRKSKIREMLGFPCMTDLLSNKTQKNILSKAFRLKLKKDPQKELPYGKYRCVLCLKIYNGKEHVTRKAHTTYYCKKCHSKSQKLYLQEDLVKRYAKKLSHRYWEIVGITPDLKELCHVIEKVIEKYGLRCYFEDEFCDDLWGGEVSIGHKNPVNKNNPQDIVNPDNLFFICMQHNQVMLDIPLSDLKNCYKSMIDIYEFYFQNEKGL